MQTTNHIIGNLRFLALACLLAACAGDPTGTEETPGPGFVTRYDVTVTARYLRVSEPEACDGVAAISGDGRDGEFQYRIEVASNDGYFGSMESDDYNSFLGQAIVRLPGELINFTNRDFTVESLLPGDQVTITLFASEWDVASKDPRMDNRRASDVVYIGSSTPAGTARDMAINMGNSECGLTLVWDLSITKREEARP